MSSVDQVKTAATNAADNAGVGPNDSSTIESVQSGLSKGIDTVQNSVFSQKSTGQQQTKEEPKHDPDVAQAVDTARPEALEDFQRHEHRSDPVTGSDN